MKHYREQFDIARRSPHDTVTKIIESPVHCFLHEQGLPVSVRYATVKDSLMEMIQGVFKEVEVKRGDRLELNITLVNEVNDKTPDNHDGRLFYFRMRVTSHAPVIDPAGALINPSSVAGIDLGLTCGDPITLIGDPEILP